MIFRYDHLKSMLAEKNAVSNLSIRANESKSSTKISLEDVYLATGCKAGTLSELSSGKRISIRLSYINAITTYFRNMGFDFHDIWYIPEVELPAKRVKD